MKNTKRHKDLIKPPRWLTEISIHNDLPLRYVN